MGDKKLKQVIVIGAGAAGMMAAIAAARNNKKVIVIEKNEKVGKKLFITGKGRCNITNACDIEDLLSNIVTNPKFLYSALYTFTNDDIVTLLEELGCKTKVERGNRVFPVSDKSSDVIGALKRELNRLKVEILLNTEVTSLIIENGICTGVNLKNKKKMLGDAVIVATGGISYAPTGSTGDGYEFAKVAGHHIVEPVPSLVPFNIEGEEVKALQGLSLRNVGVKVFSGKKVIYEEQGELLFTHFGMSGPTILSASAYVKPKQKEKLTVTIDLKPALSEKQLDQRLLRDFEKNKNKQYKNSLEDLLPKKLIPIIMNRSNISPEKKVNEISKTERQQLLKVLKEFAFEVSGLRGFQEAIITKGGVNIKEIEPNTMESKEVKQLFFAGEVLDLDALTGGFNLQIAWSTGYLAGLCC